MTADWLLVVLAGLVCLVLLLLGAWQGWRENGRRRR